MNNTTCDFCDKEFDYDDNEIDHREDENSEGEMVIFDSVFCPHCGEATIV